MRHRFGKDGSCIRCGEDPEISLCPNCFCMTKTIKGICGKCKEKKNELSKSRRQNKKNSNLETDKTNLDVENC